MIWVPVALVAFIVIPIVWGVLRWNSRHRRWIEAEIEAFQDQLDQL